MKSRIHGARGPALSFALKPLALAVGSLLIATQAQCALADTANVQNNSADKSGQVTRLKTFVVKDKDIHDDAYVAKRSQAGTKTDTPLVETPQSISIINSAELENRNVTALTEALLYTPGTSVNPWGFDARELDWVVIRGFDGWYSSSFRDGMSQTPGIMYLGTQTEIYGLERLEQLRGPASVLFGKGDVGGIVNRVSKVPGDTPVRELEAEAGSHDRKQIAIDWGGNLDASGDVSYRVVALGLDTDTQEKYPSGDDTFRKRKYLEPSLRWQLSEKTSLILQAEILRDKASDDIQYVTDFYGNATDVKEGDPDFSKIENDTDAVGYQFSHDLDSGWRLQQKLRYSHRTTDKHNFLSWFDEDPAMLLREARLDEESVNELTVDTSIFGDVTTGTVKHMLLFGIDWDRSVATWKRHSADAPSLDMNDPVYNVDIPQPDMLAGDTEQTSRQLGVYAQDQIHFDRHWLLTLGARHDRVTSVVDDDFNAVKTDQTDSATTGRAGLSYLVGNGWAPYISYAESFMPNVGVDIDGNDFDPGHGWQTEVGVKYMPDDKPLSFTAAMFDLNKTNIITYDPVTYDPRQVGKTRSRGVELEMKAELDRLFYLTASYTRLDMEVLKSANTTEVGNFPILVPEQTASLWLDYTLPERLVKGLGFGAGVRYAGKRWNDEANTSSESGYALADAAVHYSTGPWRLALSATNLFDRDYTASRAYGSYFRGDERDVLFSVKYDL